jgi:7-carboxy-7-deazaguanine synthase
VIAMTRLRLTEMFFSLQGEARTVGWPTVFIRLTGCPLRCGYCDSEYAFYGGEYHELDAILAKVAEWAPRYVCVTGGEPLAQKGCIDLLKALCDAGYDVSLETSGALDISEVDKRVSRVVDIKTPGSGEVDKNRWANLPLLTAHDQIKFVLCDRKDYDWARMLLDQHQLHKTCDVLFSPVFSQLSYRDLAEWILADRLPVRMQLQLHKHIWGDAPGH